MGQASCATDSTSAVRGVFRNELERSPCDVTPRSPAIGWEGENPDVKGEELPLTSRSEALGSPAYKSVTSQLLPSRGEVCFFTP